MFNIIVLGIASLLTDVSTEMVYPLLPLFLTARLGASPAIVGIIEGIAESLASLLKVFSGHVSDRLGRRKPLAIFGYASSTVGKVVLYVAGSWPVVLLARVIDRFGKGVRTAPRDALIADSSAPEARGRAYGLHRAMDTLGASVGVLLAYRFLTTHGNDYSRVFLWAMAPAAMGVAALFLVREVRAGDAQTAAASVSPAPRPSLPRFQWSRLDRRLRSFLIIVFVFALGNSSNQFLLLRAADLGLGPATVLLVYFLYNAIYSLLSYPIGRLSDRIGRKAVLVAGYATYGLVYLGFALARAPWHIWALFATYGAYIAFTEGVEKALVADIAPVELRATTIGLHATLVGIGLLPASMLAGFLWNLLGPAATFAFGSVMGLVSAVGIWLVV